MLCNDHAPAHPSAMPSEPTKCPGEQQSGQLAIDDDDISLSTIYAINAIQGHT